MTIKIHGKSNIISRKGKGKSGLMEGFLIKGSYPTKKKLEYASFSFQAFNRMQYL